MKLSIVTTLYQSEPYIVEFYQRATASAQKWAENNYEIIFVNDGSPDNSLELVVSLSKTDEHVVVVDLSRNFGHHKAMMTGLSYAQGEYVFLIDSDLEEQPEWLLDFAEHMQKQSCDVVYGVQIKRKGGWFERWSGALYYSVLKWVMHCEIPRNIVTTRLMSQRYVAALLSHCEREMAISGLWQLTGFSQVPFTIEKLKNSTTTYTLRKKTTLLINSITSFSNVPLISIFYIGLGIFLSASIYTSYLIIRWLFFTKLLDGWTSLIASIWLLGGLIILFIGIVGIYLAKVFIETKKRPYTVIRAVYSKSGDNGSHSNKTEYYHDS